MTTEEQKNLERRRYFRQDGVEEDRSDSYKTLQKREEYLRQLDQLNLDYLERRRRLRDEN